MIKMLRMENYSVLINDKKIINNFSYKFHPNKIYAIIGKNGSGKTTFLKSIIAYPGIKSIGNIFFKNKNISELDLHERTKLGIIMVFQEFPKFDVPTNEIFNIKKEYIKILNLNNLINKKLFSEMSSGEKKRIDLGICLSLNPNILLIDEIDSGVDLESKKLIINAINYYISIKKEFLILMVSHDINFLKNFTIEKYLEIKNGNINEKYSH